MVRLAEPCTYLAPTLTLSPNRLKWDSTWPTSPRSSIACVQNGLWSYGMFCANHAPILHQQKHSVQTDQNEIPRDARHQEFHRFCPTWFSSLCYVRHKPYTYLASRLALSPNRPKWASSWATSPRSTIGCVQNDSWAYDMFRANCAPISYR
jgi:hypothetical protein